MKKLILLACCVVYFGGCNSSNGPASSGSPALMPQDGSTFTYAYSGTSPAVQLTERVTIKDTSGSKFFVALVSDTVSGFFTTSIDYFVVLASGDLDQPSYCLCDNLPLPIATHLSYRLGERTTPVKLNGIVGRGSVFDKSDYLGEETISAAGENFSCSKVTESDSISLIFPNNDSLNGTIQDVRTFWYSVKLGYFAMEREDHSLNGAPLSLAWTRTLTAYKLGK